MSDYQEYNGLKELGFKISQLRGERSQDRFAIDAMNGQENNDFTDSEAMVLNKLMDKSVMTSSFGRILDALSFSLGVCTQRTYDGEPAMKLEPLLARGRSLLKKTLKEVYDFGESI